jgi:hypothetical protein
MKKWGRFVKRSHSISMASFAYSESFYTFVKKIMNNANSILLFGAEIYLGLKFYFYANDHKPIHVHVSYENKEARFQVENEILLIENHGLRPREIKCAELAIEENREVIIQRWNEFFNKKENRDKSEEH